MEEILGDLLIRQITTQGFDPSANGAGENAVRFSYFLTGSRLTTRWWGVAALATAFYSRCEAGIEEWPEIPFGSRAMLVKDPPDRDAFMPRAVPNTVFGPSTRVSGGMVV